MLCVPRRICYPLNLNLRLFTWGKFWTNADFTKENIARAKLRLVTHVKTSPGSNTQVAGVPFSHCY